MILFRGYNNSSYIHYAPLLLMFMLLMAAFSPPVAFASVDRLDTKCAPVDKWGGQCQIDIDVPGPAQPLPPVLVDVGSPIVPYWLWYRAYCGGSPRVVCDSVAGADLVPAVCERDGREGVWMGLWRQDYIPPGAPYEVAGMVCVADVNELPPPDRPDPIVRLSDIDFYRLVQSPIIVEPFPNTLIRYPTNIYTRRTDQNFTMTLLGRTVLVTVHPIRYEWDYGDGTQQTFTGPGGPRRPDQISRDTMTSHLYQKTGSYPIRLTTYYHADYNVEGGPLHQIEGEGQTVAGPSTIEVWKTRTRHVQDSCTENPDSWGCPQPTP